MTLKHKLRKLYFKIVKQEGSPESIGRAMAVGLFIGFILPVGTQTIPALALAFVFKANKALTWIFTNISNVVTMWFLYPIQCYTGSLLIFRPLNFSELWKLFSGDISLAMFKSLGADIIISFFVGGLFYGIIFAVGGYWSGVRIVTLYRRKKEERRLAKKQKRREDLLAREAELKK